MPNITQDLDTHLAKTLNTAYTVTANGTATITGTLTARQLDDLIRISHLKNYDVIVTAGVLTLQRR